MVERIISTCFRTIGRPRCRWSLAALTLVATLGAAAEGSRASLTWQAQTLSAAGANATTPRLAVSRSGHGVVTWGRAGVRSAAFRAPGEYVAPAASTLAVADVDRAIDGRGRVIFLATSGGLRYAIRSPGQPVGAFAAVPGASGTISAARVAANDAGDAVVVWAEVVGSNSRLMSSVLGADGRLGSAQSFATVSGLPRGLDLAVDARGNALAAWGIDGGSSFVVDYAYRSAGGTFGAPARLSAPGQNADSPDVAMHDDGRAVVVYSSDFEVCGSCGPGGTRSRQTFLVTAADLTAGTVTARAPLTAWPSYGRNDPRPQVAIDATGATQVAWRGLWAPREAEVYTRVRPAAGSFGAAIAHARAPGTIDAIFAEDLRLQPQLAAGGAGAIAAWDRDIGGVREIESVERVDGGPFAARQVRSAEDLGARDQMVAMDGTGTAVVAWVGSDGANDRLRIAFGFAPVPPGPEPPSPGEPPVVPPPAVPPGEPPPPPEPPEPIAITPARPIKRGAATVLTAQVPADTMRLEWQVPGGAITGTVVGGALQRSVRFRSPTRPHVVRVRAIGPRGTQTFSRELAGVPAPADAGDAAILKALARVPDVVAAGHTDVLIARAGARARQAGSGPCAVTVQAAASRFSGCLRPVESVADLPAAERGILDQLAGTLKLERRSAVVDRALALADPFVARSSVALADGFPIAPRGGASVVLAADVGAIASSNATVRVGGVDVSPRGGFVLPLDPKRAEIPFGTIPRPPSLPKIGGFPIVGDLDVKLVDGVAQVTGKLQLPSFLRRAGGDAQAQVTLRATSDRFVVDDLTIGPMDVQLGALRVDAFRLAYRRASDEWQGQGRACVASGVCLDMVPPNGQIKIKDGRLDFAGASLGFPPPGVPLFAGVGLERIGFGVGLGPTRFTGNALLSFAQILTIDGRLVVAFPTVSSPYRLVRDEVGGGFPAHLYSVPRTGTTIGVSADAALRLPVGGSVPLANAYVLYEAPGYLAFGGGFDADVVGVVSLRGGVTGEFDTRAGTFQIAGNVRACVVDVVCAGAIAVVSRGAGGTGGAGACIDVGPLSVGGGVQWQRVSAPFIWPFDGCKWSRFTAVVRSRSVHAPPPAIDVVRGEPGRALRLDGAQGAPRIRVATPDGTVLESPAGPGLVTSPDGAVRILRSERLGQVVVGVTGARPGRYAVEALPGSPPITGVAQATDQPAARIRARVEGGGERRVLQYDVGRRVDQRVTFVELTAGGGARTIGVVAGGGRGALRFRPAPGTGTRRVVANFELAGLPAESRTVARFTPPSPRLRRPGGLRVRRDGSRLRVSWRAVPGADRYEVVMTPAAGPQRVLRTTRPRAVLARVARATSGRITVRAVAPLRESTRSAVRVRPAAARRGAFRALPRCQRQQRLVCRAPRRS